MNVNKKIITNFYFDKPKNQTSSGDDPLQISLSTSIIRLSASGLRPSADNLIISVDNESSLEDNRRFGLIIWFIKIKVGNNFILLTFYIIMILTLIWFIF